MTQQTAPERPPGTCPGSDGPLAVPRHPFVRGALLAAAAATGCLIVVDLGIRTFHEYVAAVPALRLIFNVGTEGNLATWWNTALLLSVAGTALVAAALSGRTARPGRRSWLGLALAAAWLSIDESAQVHERLAGPGNDWAREHGITLPTYAWILPGSLLAVAGTVCAVLWARRLPPDVRRGLLGALAAYFSGALAVEAFNGWAKRQGADAVYALGTSVEEGLEMGACLMVLATLAKVVLLVQDPISDRLIVRLR
ncbi:hypothetical protein [Actinomadura sp. 9N407]|uniref:hypothetical protein n=1 Tax=Actinomadura sp. 9N407 TaxID=3375154 RepID=UPI0037BD391E